MRTHVRHPARTNRLWIARKRVGYPLKWVTSLLGKRSLSSVSDYERGRKVPTLPTALKLQAIYQTPLADLFPHLYARLAEEVARDRQANAAIVRHDAEVMERAGQSPSATHAL